MKLFYIAPTNLDDGRSHIATRRPSALYRLFFLAVVLVVLTAAGEARAAGPQWTVTSVSAPTNFTPGDESGDASYRVTVTNTGTSATNGSLITITDELPTGLTIGNSGASGEDQLIAAIDHLPGGQLQCVKNACSYSGAVIPDDTLVLTIPVNVSSTAPGTVVNRVHVAGGGAPDAGMETPTTISTEGVKFGVASGGATTALSTTQAGAHPDLTTSIAFNTINVSGSLAGDPKDTTDDLPPGFAGDLVDTPSCSSSKFSLSECPIGTQIGVTTLTIDLFGGGRRIFTDPVYNLSPNPGELARLGFYAANDIHIEGGVTLRENDYGLRATFQDTNESSAELDNVSLTIWGVPAAPVHDPLRWRPPVGSEQQGSFGVSSDSPQAPFITNPTSCSGVPLEARFKVDSWEKPGLFESTGMEFGPVVGCDRLTMGPSLTAQPTTEFAYSATGFNVEMNIPQTYDNAFGLATSTLKRAVVGLPEGVTVNPSAGAGLEACSQAQYEEEGVEPTLTKGCPSASKLGVVHILTPALSEEVIGAVYLAKPRVNQFGSLLAIYIVARIQNRGVVVRAAGDVQADLSTGRLVTTFDGLPPLPFSKFTLSFRQGATSPLVTPPRCGQYSVNAELTPWALPSEILKPLVPPFAITSGFNGTACPTGGAPFAPQVFSGTLNNQAGSYSAMYIRVIRGDGEQEVTRFSAQLPTGVTADLSGVPFCSEANIERARTRTGASEEAESSCPKASEIGHTLVGAGVGSVLAWASGKVYMAGPYHGAPFSIVAITAARVGPFDLGTVVVREALKIDPTTAAVTVDASASDPIPHIIEGIVVHVRDIRVYIDRPNFTLNPTSCATKTFAVTVNGSGEDFTSSSDDVPVTVNVPFQAADCQSLKFSPTFAVSTTGKTSRRSGASLTARLTFAHMPGNSQANVRSVKVDLPKRLPSRLTTLQKACPASVFADNPASCPSGSRVGQATAVTPILPVALSGPAYFVSHGGAKFPELVIVLQGYGVTIDLHGETFISKNNITSSTFRVVPDEPVTSFVLQLPQGPDSALAAVGNLCAGTLIMPTIFTAQNGLTIRRNVSIKRTECGRRNGRAKLGRRHHKPARRK